MLAKPDADCHNLKDLAIRTEATLLPIEGLGQGKKP